MRFKLGERVVKCPCPSKCGCDGFHIPPGSEGVIHKDRKPQHTTNPFGTMEMYYTVSWIVNGQPKMWGSYEHGIESFDNFLDISYLEGV